MKKYSSYADLKLCPSPKAQYWPTKMITTPSGKKNSQVPVMVISKQSFAIPMTAKYSAGYLQRKKMFSAKKENKDEGNIVSRAVNLNCGEKSEKIVLVLKGNQCKENLSRNKKSEKMIDEREKVVKKDKGFKLDLENKQNNLYKPYRFEVQSPKGAITRNKEEKSKSKLKEKEKEKGLKYIVLKPNESHREKQKPKQEQQLKQLVTKYQPDNKNWLIHCASQNNLIKQVAIQNQQKKQPQIKGYYRSPVAHSFFSTKSSKFNEICRSHLTTSIQFLSYVKKSKSIIPENHKKIKLPPTNKKTIIFDLDETLIHCNQSLDMPNDLIIQIAFPNNVKIKAGINIRPYASECLKELSKYFQIIVFTASHQCYANVIVDHLDPNREYVSYRFFRETCYKTQEGFYVKDLRVFGRDLSTMLLVDNAAYSYCFQPENGVPIIPFYNSKTDFELKQVTNYLKEFQNVKNMRTKNDSFMKLTQYHKFVDPKQLINQLYL